MGFEAEFKEWKDKYFGPYCMTKCDKTCCDMRNVTLHVNGEELKKLFGKKPSKEEMAGMGITMPNDKGLYCLETKDFCPKFDSAARKCLDYEHRSKSCREFPFVVETDALIIKSGCPLKDSSPEYKKIAQIATRYGKVIVKRAG
jgi:Fe-S-cluster containining protein